MEVPFYLKFLLTLSQSPRAQLIIGENETFVSKEEYQKMTISMINGPEPEVSSLEVPSLSESLVKAAEDKSKYFTGMSIYQIK